jgi:hypothetical protein
MTNEGGVTLRMGLTPLSGTALTAVPGQQQGNAVVYPAPDPATTRDVAVDATTSGFNVRVVLHNANENPSVTLRVALDSPAYLQQEPSGTIQVTRPITSYGDSSTTPIVTLGPEFVIGRAAAVDASAGAAAVQTASSASLSLGPSSNGAQSVSVAVDPTWLHATGRTFPVTITIPVATALSAAHTGIATTVNSCASANPPTPTDIVVGVVGSCTDQGKLYFALPHVPGGSTVVSATLGLYAPDQSTATGVQVAMDGPLPLPYIAPSALDQSANPTLTLPAVAAGAVGIAEQPATGSNMHTWDVTAIVRQWFQDVRTNSGLTLMGGGAPVAFQSPMGSGSPNPALDPVLSITYAPAGSISPSYSDGGYTIYGLSGTFSSCSAPNFQCAPAGPISVTGAYNLVGPQGYVRLEAQLSCTLNTMPVAINNDPQDINTMLNVIFDNNQAPVVVLTANPGCLTAETPSFWQQQANYFATNMSYPKTSLIYFEIGNEPNITRYGGSGTYYGYGGSQQGYAERFADAAYGIVTAMVGGTRYRILTGGMSQPTADITCSTLGDVNFDAAYLAITEAEGAPNNISASLLGVAVHPYQYRTNEFPYYWRNYHGSWSGAPYANICSDLNSMLGFWTANFPNMPVFFTEDNWADQPSMSPSNLCASSTQCEGTYLADLFTWLIDYGYANHSTSQIRLAWFNGFDIPGRPLGVRSSAAGEKYLALSTCPDAPALQSIPTAVWTIFFYLDYPGYTCY